MQTKRRAVADLCATDFALDAAQNSALFFEARSQKK